MSCITIQPPIFERGTVYDSLYRLVTFERLVPSTSVGTPGLPGASVVKDWKIEGVQNWRELITNGATTTTTVDAVNQYSTFGAAAPDHDLNGNLLTPDVGGAPAVSLEYDFLNRLRRVTSTSGGSIEHDYDAEGRRVRTRSSGVASMPAVSEFVFDGWEEIEEHVKAASGSPFALARRYVHGRGLDEPLRLENLAFYPGPGTYWFQQSTLGNVAALADTSGAIVERYSYDAYGLPQFETPANVAKAVTESDFGNPYLFHARHFEPALYPLYDFRARFLDPTRGRFVQRDPPGTWHDELNFGGAMAFGGNIAPNVRDPFGREALSAGVVTGVVMLGIAFMFAMLMTAEELQRTCPRPTLPRFNRPVDEDFEQEPAPPPPPPTARPRPANPGAPRDRKPPPPKSGEFPFGPGGSEMGPPVTLLPFPQPEATTPDASSKLVPKPSPSKPVKRARRQSTRRRSRGSESYTVHFESGMLYHGKGPYGRALYSADRILTMTGDTPTRIDWTPAATDRDGFKDEARRLLDDGGPRNPNNYNQIQSPGNNYLKQDGQWESKWDPYSWIDPDEPPCASSHPLFQQHLKDAA